MSEETISISVQDQNLKISDENISSSKPIRVAEENEIIEHEIYNLVKSNDLILSQKTLPFDFDNPPVDPLYLANSLIATMNHNNGMGLSANQCGLPYRVFAMKSDKFPIIFNPVVLAMGDQQILLDEGCLSYPFLYVPIKRPERIRVRFSMANGQKIVERFIGITARCFLHELDHLEGINFTKRASKFHLDRAKRNQEKIKRRMKPGKRQFSENV